MLLFVFLRPVFVWEPARRGTHTARATNTQDERDGVTKYASVTADKECQVSSPTPAGDAADTQRANTQQAIFIPHSAAVEVLAFEAEVEVHCCSPTTVPSFHHQLCVVGILLS